MTNKKGDKTGEKGDKQDKKGNKKEIQRETLSERQTLLENMAKGEKGGLQQRRTWETNEWKCYMASGKGRTPAVTDLRDK